MNRIDLFFSFGTYEQIVIVQAPDFAQRGQSHLDQTKRWQEKLWFVYDKTKTKLIILELVPVSQFAWHLHGITYQRIRIVFFLQRLEVAHIESYNRVYTRVVLNNQTLLHRYADPNCAKV